MAGKDTMKAEDVLLISDLSPGRWQFPAGSVLGANKGCHGTVGSWRYGEMVLFVRRCRPAGHLDGKH